MAVKNDMSDDVLRYLRERHTGAEKAVISGDIELNFGIGGAAVRQIVNKLRCNGQPVCSDASGYFYAKNSDEINATITQLLGRTKKVTEAAQGLVLSHQTLRNGGGGV
jgi:biotin operon repressor